VFDCADGWLILATGNDAQYRRLCTLLGLPDMATDPAYLTNAQRITNRTEMTRRLTDATRQLTKSALLAACEADGVPAGPINDLAEVFADPQVVARAMQIAPDGVPGVRSPMTFSGADLALGRTAPTLGQDD
jgi:crotonobetainyl-CoA:carnitine CoA-transferase CaiB-like acyl-CoA transferase